MAELVYVLCAATSVFCAGLLLRSYFRQRTRLLMWSSLCFVGLAVNNILLFVDLVLVPGVDLTLVRTGTALVAMLLLVIGLIWEGT
ncbi:MAG TPA: DUF5985 family protein [Kofleriaceae bacterium]|nr:DUF5985 family protein [Kofleriaceae bacterium]